MSFHALALATQALECLPPEDDEFGLTWADLEVSPELDVTWVLYRAEGGRLIFGVFRVQPEPISRPFYPEGVPL